MSKSRKKRGIPLTAKKNPQSRPDIPKKAGEIQPSTALVPNGAMNDPIPPIEWSWDFSRPDKNGDFQFPPEEGKDKASILDKLGALQPVVKRGQHSKDHHLVPFYKLDSKAQKRIEKLFPLEEERPEHFQSIRLTGRKRLWGIWQGGSNCSVLRVLWWDPEHRICPSLKKHT